jgi:hypothetical protein
MFETSLPDTFGSAIIGSGFPYSDERAVFLAPVSLPVTSGTIGTLRGHALMMLGHAAEHLASSRRFAAEVGEGADDQAIHLLRRASREVFEEYAKGFLKAGNGCGFDGRGSGLFTNN